MRSWEDALIGRRHILIDRSSRRPICAGEVDRPAGAVEMMVGVGVNTKARAEPAARPCLETETDAVTYATLRLRATDWVDSLRSVTVPTVTAAISRCGLLFITGRRRERPHISYSVNASIRAAAPLLPSAPVNDSLPCHVNPDACVAVRASDQSRYPSS